jgi:predicted nucleic acid-binding protein
VQRIFVDTNVLFPFSVMDVLLALTEDGIHEVLWTEALLEEWARVVTRDHGRSTATAASITDAIREFFADCEVPEADYAHLVPDMPGKDADDRSHMAAAIAGGARVLVTWNRSDFPTEPLSQHGLRVMDPDDYLCQLVDDVPDEVAATVVRLAGEKQRPRMSTLELVDALEKAGVPRFAGTLRERLSDEGQA